MLLIVFGVSYWIFELQNFVLFWVFPPLNLITLILFIEAKHNNTKTKNTYDTACTISFTHSHNFLPSFYIKFISFLSFLLAELFLWFVSYVHSQAYSFEGQVWLFIHWKKPHLVPTWSLNLEQLILQFITTNNSIQYLIQIKWKHGIVLLPLISLIQIKWT